jgi:cytochrome c5
MASFAALAGLAAALAGLGAAAPAAQAKGPGGEAVYQSTCSTCHERGQMKAPIVGDRKAWAPLIKEGQATLTGVAWVGIRRMPPRGGNPDLTLEEFARATVHMANAAGANWKEPDEALLARIRAVEKRQLERQKK